MLTTELEIFSFLPDLFFSHSHKPLPFKKLQYISAIKQKRIEMIFSKDSGSVWWMVVTQGTQY